MIPHLNSLLEMNRQGEMPMSEIVSYIVKSIAQEGGRADYDELPLEIREEILKTLTWYREGGGWLLASSSGMEDYSGYAERFIEIIGWS
jgi:hypothetical protein